MFQLVQENNMLKMKYYELLGEYNKLKNDRDLLKIKSSSEIDHLNKINAFLKNKSVELNKTIVDRNKQVLHAIKSNHR